MPLISSKTPSHLNCCSHLLSFCVCAMWPQPLPGEGCVLGASELSGAEEAWLAPHICLFLAGIQLGNRQLQAGIWRSSVSRQLCQLLDQLCWTKTSRPHPAWFALKSTSLKYLLGLFVHHTPGGDRDQWAECRTAPFTSKNLYEEFPGR